MQGQNIAAVSNGYLSRFLFRWINFSRFVQIENLVPICEKSQRLDLFDLDFKYFASGATSVNAKAAKAIGGFDTGFYGYGAEDEEFGYRFKNMVARPQFLPNAITNVMISFILTDISLKPMKLVGVTIVCYMTRSIIF